MLFMPVVVSHGQSHPDTLTQARELLREKKLDDAFHLLSAYYPNRKMDGEAIWLYAQTAYWTGKFKLSDQLYQEAIVIRPDDAGLRLEYAKMLMETGYLTRSKRILSALILQNPNHAQAWQYLATNEYYSAKLQAAYVSITKSLELDSQLAGSPELVRDIQLMRSPYIIASFLASQDDQPMHGINNQAEIGKSHSSLLNPSLNISIPIYYNDTLNKTFRKLALGNEIRLMEQSLQINLSAGIMMYPEGKSEWIGKLEVGKKIWKRLSFSGQWERRPYLSTLSSLGAEVIEEEFSFRSRWDNPGRWNGEFLCISSGFPGDNNHIFNMAGWFFAPSIRIPRFDLALGYGYSFGNAEESRFVSYNTLETIISQNLYLDPIEGIYAPYFTPRNQHVHSLLGVLTYKPMARASLTVSANYGFFAQADYPYLYLNQNKQGQIYLEREFQRTQFNPLEVKLSGQYNLIERVILSILVRHSTTLFYQSLGAGLSLKVRI